LSITFSVILEEVTSQLKVDAVDVLLLNLHTQTLEFAAGQGFRTDALQHTLLRLGEGYAGRAALERQFLHIPDLRGKKTEFLRSPYFSAEGFVTYYVVPLIAKGELKGVLEVFHRSPYEADAEWRAFFETLAGQAAIAIDNFQLFEGLQRSTDELSQAYDETIEGWSHALDLRDKETEGHSQRVTKMTLKLAHAFDINEADLVRVRWGALLHDIGKMGVPDYILLKPGPLTDEEWVLMKKHPTFAYEMLSSIHYLKTALDIPYCHHEKWDGTGYPRGLKGKQIPLAARIFAVVDVWDAMKSDRPYRPGWTDEKVREHIRTLAGTHFDPQVVEVFLKMEDIANE
jgi:putative nucleotidyltransferase with HDIG domain